MHWCTVLECVHIHFDSFLWWALARSSSRFLLSSLPRLSPSPASISPHIFFFFLSLSTWLLVYIRQADAHHLKICLLKILATLYLPPNRYIGIFHCTFFFQSHILAFMQCSLYIQYINLSGRLISFTFCNGQLCALVRFFIMTELTWNYFVQTFSYCRKMPKWNNRNANKLCFTSAFELCLARNDSLCLRVWTHILVISYIVCQRFIAIF